MHEIAKHKVAWVKKNEAAVDFALISLADNVILSYGTYGFISALIFSKSKGEVLSPLGYEKTFENLYIQHANIPRLKYIYIYTSPAGHQLPAI